MLLLGLTGSIATGKTTVSNLLSSPPYNLPIIDADLLARQVVEPGTTGYAQIVEHFLPDAPTLVTTPNGPLNRAVLGQRVFGTVPERVSDRNVLNGIVHPLVRKEIARRVAREYVSGAWAVVLDVPLLFEAGMEVVCGGCLVVGVGNEEVQLKRLVDRDPALGVEGARRRVQSQWGVEEKVGLARRVFGGRAWVVDNSGGLEDLAGEVARVMAEVERGRRGWGWRVLWGFPVVAGGWAVWCVLGNWWRRRAWEREKRERMRAV